MNHIFVPAVGQYDNIGDIILRRPLLDALREHGTLHVYLGDYPQGYRESLRLSADDVVYRSFWSWYRAVMRAAARGNAHYVFKPGEIQLTVRGMKEHVGMLPALALVRMRGGRVVRAGSGARNFAPLPRALMRPSIALSQIVVWRDRETASYLGGDVMPDWGFAEGSAGHSGSRELFVVSMRGDRPTPDAAWIKGMRLVAAARNLQIVVVTQVGRDSARTRELASALEARTVDWDGVDHAAQEERLRELYRQAAIVASDRLHVLIAAVTEGAAVVAPLPSAATKIDRHFESADFAPVSVVTASLTAEQIQLAVDRVLASARPESLTSARASLAEVADRLSRLLRGGSTQ